MTRCYNDEELAAIAYAYIYSVDDGRQFSHSEDEFFLENEENRNAAIRAVKWLRKKPRDMKPEDLFEGFYLRWNLTYARDESIFSTRNYLRSELILSMEETTYDYLEAIESLQKLFNTPSF